MAEPQTTRERRLTTERMLYRYNQALERGDIDTIAVILQAASQDAELERMIYELHALPGQKEGHITHHLASRDLEEKTVVAAEPGLLSLASNRHVTPTRWQRSHLSLQILAAVLVIAVLITSSVLLYISYRYAPGTGKRSDVTRPVPTKTIVTAQGTIIELLTNGAVAALHGGTFQSIWSYSTGQNSQITRFYGLAVQKHVVYAAADGTISALHENNGSPIWQQSLPLQPEGSSDPTNQQFLVDAGLVYASYAYSDQNSVLFVLNANSGQILWHVTSTDLTKPLLTAGNGTTFVAIENAAMAQTTLEALNSTNGNVIWYKTYPGEIGYATYADKTLYIYAFPRIAPAGNADNKVYKELHALTASDGSTVWTTNVSYGNYRSISYAQGVLLIDTGDQVCVYSSKNGSRLWCSQSLDPQTAAVGALIYLIGSDKLYQANVTEKTTPLSPAEIRKTCGSNVTCIEQGQKGAFGHVQYSFQIEALDFQHGHILWISNNVAYSHTASIYSKPSPNLLLLQEGMLLVYSGAPLSNGSYQVIALNTSNGQTLWQVDDASQQKGVLQREANTY